MDYLLAASLILILLVYLTEILLWQLWCKWYYRTGIIIYKQQLVKPITMEAFVKKIDSGKHHIKYHKCENQIILRPKGPVIDIGYTRWIIFSVGDGVSIECRVSYLLPVLYLLSFVYTKIEFV